MSRRRVSRVSMLIACTLLVLLPYPVGAAESVIYRTPAGQVVLSNRPLPSGAEILYRVPARTRSALRLGDGGAVGVPAPAPHLSPSLQDGVPVPAPHATTVDPVGLALVTRDMAAADVRRTLGAPEGVVSLDPEVRMSSERSRATAGRLKRSVWMYPGTVPGGRVLIWLVNGHVERVERAW